MLFNVVYHSQNDAGGQQGYLAVLSLQNDSPVDWCKVFHFLTDFSFLYSGFFLFNKIMLLSVCAWTHDPFHLEQKSHHTAQLHVLDLHWKISWHDFLSLGNNSSFGNFIIVQETTQHFSAKLACCWVYRGLMKKKFWNRFWVSGRFR